MTTETLDLIQATLLGDAVENVPVAVLVADDEMRYVAVNRFACELLGYGRDELLERSVTDVSPFDGSVELFRELMIHGRLSGRTRVVAKDGTEREVDFDAFATTVAHLPAYVSFCRLVENGG